MTSAPQKTGLVSVILSPEGDGVGLKELIQSYLSVLDSEGSTYEVIIVFDHTATEIEAVAKDLASAKTQVKLHPMRPWGGEDAAIKLGTEQSVGDVILTLPAWQEIDPEGIRELLRSSADADMVIGNREGQVRSPMQKMRAGATHGMLRVLFRQNFSDVFCRARIGRRDVFLRSAELGVRHHFLPLIAASEGYKVQEVPLPMSKGSGSNVYRFKPNAHVGALVDVLTLFVALKFLKRPLRFFGAVGVPLALIGALLTLYLVVERLFFGAPLADRPALVFAVIMLVLGIQIVALGLVGEIIIFSSSRRLRNYEIEKIIRGRPSENSPTDAHKADDPPQGDEGKA